MTPNEHDPATAPPYLPDAPGSEDCFGLERWYTLVRGLDTARRMPLDTLRGPETELPAVGEARLFVDSEARALGSRSRLAQADWSHLPADVHVDRFVVLPGSGGARVLVPAAPGAARILGTALLPAGRRRWRVLAQLLGREPGSTLIDRCGRPEVLVLARNSANQGALAPLGNSAVAMSEGVPGPLAKRVVAISSQLDNHRSILKQAMGSEAAARIAQERRVLVELHELGVAPTLLHAGGRGCQSWLLQSNVEGKRGPDRLGKLHGAFVRTLESGRSGDLEYGALPGIRLARIALSRAGLDDAQETERRTLAGLERALESSFRRRRVPIAYGHGDFAPWNLRTQGQQLVAFDWEFADARLPRGFDLLHHHFQVGVLVRRQDPEALLAEAPAALARAGQPELRMGRDAALGLYVLIAASRDLAAEQISPAQHSQANWLRLARVQWAQRLTARLRNATGHEVEACPRTGRTAA